MISKHGSENVHPPEGQGEPGHGRITGWRPLSYRRVKSHLLECCLKCRKPWVRFLVLEAGCGSHNPRTQERKAGGSEVQNQPGIQ